MSRGCPSTDHRLTVSVDRLEMGVAYVAVFTVLLALLSMTIDPGAEASCNLAKQESPRVVTH